MEGLCFRPPPALLGMPAPPLPAVNVDVRTPPHHHSPFQACAAGRSGAAAGSAMEAAGGTAGSGHCYAYARPPRKLWAGSGPSVRNDEPDGVEERKGRAEEQERRSGEEGEAAARTERRRRAGNWVLKILRARLASAAEDGRGEGRSGGDGFLQNDERWPSNEQDRDRMLQGSDRCAGCCRGEESSSGCAVVDSDGETELDRDAFGRLLRRVPLKEARLFAQLSYLGRLAYTIPRIKPANLLKYHRLRFATSSLEKKQQLPIDGKVRLASQDQGLERKQKLLNVENVQPPCKDKGVEKERELPHAEKVKLAAQDQGLQQQKENEGCRESRSQQKNGHLISAISAYKVAASAASYLQSQTRSILPFGPARSELGLSLTGVASEDGDRGLTSSEVVSFVATTNSVTAVVAAKEETKQAVAKDLNSSKSSPCEWFICDDENSKTRFFVIQGSESVASWQANLLFEPIQFEGMDVMVHRGIYEAAKGIYQQMLPHVRSHLMAYGSSATFRFTGHSLGGSLSLLVSLMLLIRSEVPPSSLLPVVTFGSPYIICGGDYLLQKLGLPLNYVKAVMMHRDIVPRAFSCNYPDHVTEILKAVNGKFRNHPCLRNQRLLYAPMGQLLILQPEEKYSPHHDLLPAGAGLYVLRHKSPNSRESTRILRSAQSMFLNTPHPLEMLSDRAAYGAEGTVCRDHDVNAYLTSLRGIICQELKLMRKHKRERRRRGTLRPLMPSQGINTRTMVDGQTGGADNSSHPHHQGFSIVVQGGMQSLRRLVSSGDVHMLVLFFVAIKDLAGGGTQGHQLHLRMVVDSHTVELSHCCPHG